MILAVAFMAIGLVLLILGAKIVETLPGRGVLILFTGAFMLSGTVAWYIIERSDNQCRHDEICIDR